MDRISEMVYESLLGERLSPVPGIANEFAPGSICDQHYENVQKAYQRLRIKLGIENEDRDIEIMLQELSSIQRILCLKMYRYGAMSQQEDLLQQKASF